MHELKKVSEKEVVEKVKAIWAEFLDPNSALSPVNIDSKCMDKTRKETQGPNPGRHTFDDARVSSTHTTSPLSQREVTLSHRITKKHFKSRKPSKHTMLHGKNFFKKC